MEEEVCETCGAFVIESDLAEMGHRQETCEVCGVIACDSCAEGWPESCYCGCEDEDEEPSEDDIEFLSS